LSERTPLLPRDRTAAAYGSLLTSPILPTLAALSLPNLLALGTQSLVAIAETSYIGILGTESLAAMALVFPMIMLTQMMSSGAMGGGVSSAISRAIGARDERRARALAFHALIVAALAGALFTVVFLIAGPAIYTVLGGDAAVLPLALQYSGTFFAGASIIWFFNILASITRGTGNMRVPSSTVIVVALLQIILGGLMGLGFGPIPRFGLTGIAAGQILAFLAGTIALLCYLRSRHTRLRLDFTVIRLDRALFWDILKVGAVSCLSPLQSILTVIILAKFVAAFGTTALAGYGIGVRLELLLVPIAFSIGSASVPMVGMAIGAGDVARARRVAWIAATASAVIIGGIGCLAALNPALWATIFTTDPAVELSADDYLSIAGFGFAAYGFGLCLYFASQGSGRIVGPVLGGTVRLLVVLVGGILLMQQGGDFRAFALLVTIAMAAYGVSTGLFVWRTRWGEAG
jgi:putative MATE family efflux protein